MTRTTSSLQVCFGPLRYRLLAHDDWGRKALSLISGNLDFRTFEDSPDTTIHLLKLHLKQREFAKMPPGYLPKKLAELVPDVLPEKGWKQTGDGLGCLSWYNEKVPRESFLTYRTVVETFEASLWLPWRSLFADMVKKGGGLLHGGLAVLKNRGYIFTAPPGGGKTTALSRIPPPWKVLADDAALIWPAGPGIFRASPLPTWGNILRNYKTFVGDKKRKVSHSVVISGIIFIKKGPLDKISPVQPLEASQRLYRAFSEHPGVISSRRPFRTNLFHTACGLAKSAAAQKLELTIDGKYWQLLERLADD